MNRLVSVVIPVWNTGENACRLIRKLLEHKYKEIEIIVVDDGSADDSLAELKKVAREKIAAGRVKVLTQKNAGAAAARNAAMDISRGEYICFLDSDDMVADNYIGKMVKALESGKNAVMAVCGMHFNKIASGTKNDAYISPMKKQSNRESLADYVIWSMIRDGRMYSSVNKIFRAEVIRENNLKFEVGRKFAEDTNFVLKYLEYSSGDIIFVPEALYIYNFGTDTSTVKKSSLLWKNWEKSYEDVKRFAEKCGRGGIKTWVLLKLLKLRWRVSHYRSVKRAKKAGEKESGKVGKFVVVGIVVTLFDFLVCTILTRWIFGTNDAQELAAGIATFAATFVAYFLHSRITWKTRKPSKLGIVKFFIWNMLAAIVIKPMATWMFGMMTGLYQMAFGITEWLHLPFDYDAVEYLGVYALATIVVMVLNFFFYDKLVFDKK